MVYIMAGGNIAQAFKDLCIPENEAYRVYSTKNYQIWKVSETTVNTLYSVPNPKWNSQKWGWWIYSKKSIFTYPIEDIKVNGHTIMAWVNPKVKAREFSCIADYTDTMWNKSSDRAFLDIATNLADLNEKNIEELVSELGE